jgi:DNA-binding NtrC family response regulator
MPTPTTQALIVTEDAELGSTLVEVLASHSVQATIVSGGDAAGRLAEAKPDFVVGDLDLARTDPVDLLRTLRSRLEPGQLLLLAGPDSLDHVEEAARLGLPWYQKKPVRELDIRIAVSRALVANGFGNSAQVQLLGSSPGIQSALKLATQVAFRGGHLTVMGEPGVGKRLFGRLIHEQSPRGGQDFRHFSCAGLSESVVDAELFGLEEAHGGERHEGLLKQCHQGTLMIEEISQLPVRSQQRLLKCLTLKSVRPVRGRANSAPSDVRIFASSSQPLDDLVSSGSFMGELFDRISGVRVDLQPLRDRKSDIPMLADHFVRRSGQRSGRSFKGITPDGLDRLMRHSWPGNVRELEDMIIHAMSVASGPWLAAEDLPALPEAVAGQSAMVPGSTIQEIEKEAILKTIDAAGGSTGRAARILNMSVRKIQYKLKEYRRESASTLRSETVRSVPSPPAAGSDSPLPKKKSVFVAGRDSGE